MAGRPQHATAPPQPAPEPARLILASTSRWRRELLQRFGLPFDVVAPEVDEAPRAGETPAALARRLARAKAQAVARAHPQATVIGSDQVADLAGQALGKPGHPAAAMAQWRAMRGQRVRFHTAVCVAHGGRAATRCATVTVHCRDVDDAAIDRYLLADQPWDCAGSARVESLGITMLDAVVSRDPTALVGLPLIATAALLRAAGWRLP